MIADNPQTATEYQSKLGWGHGTLEGSIAWGRRLGVKTLVFTDHEPERDDDALRPIRCRAEGKRRYGDGGETSYLLSREGMEMLL